MRNLSREQKKKNKTKDKD